MLGPMSDRDANVVASYDRVASAYAAHFGSELDHKPLDRALLDAFAEELRGKGPVLDVGCGPGQITRALAARGLNAMGLDLSPGMVAHARTLEPALPYVVGSMLALGGEDATYAGISAFYAIVHLAPAELPAAFRELYRVLRPGGPLLLSFHLGDERVHLAELLEQPVDLDFTFFARATVERALEEVGFGIAAALERAPYTPTEHPTRRCYLLARKPS